MPQGVAEDGILLPSPGGRRDHRTRFGGGSGKMELHPEPMVKLKSIGDKREIVWALTAREESRGGLHGGFTAAVPSERGRQ